MARVCPACGQENADDDDFCGKCGGFLRWDPTRAVEAVPAPEAPAEVPAEAPAEPEAVEVAPVPEPEPPAAARAGTP